MRGGTYRISDSGIVITRSGSSGNPLNGFSYPGEVPILDGISMTTAYHSGFWHEAALRELFPAGSSVLVRDWRRYWLEGPSRMPITRSTGCSGGYPRLPARLPAGENEHCLHALLAGNPFAAARP